MKGILSTRTGRRMAALLYVLLSLPALGAEPGLPLRVAIGETKAPYVMAEEQRGVEYELVTSALQLAGYQPQVSFAPNKRAQEWLAAGRVDAAIANDGGYLSEPYIAYQNMAITLCRRQIRLDSVLDLGRYRVAAFQNAQRFLGPDYAAMAAGNPDYVEQSPQITVNRLLYTGRTDVAVADINVFLQFNDELGPGIDAQPAPCPYALFPPTPYRLAFRDAVARDRFNKALRLLHQQGFYEALAKRYHLPAPQGRPSFKPPAR
ncbi:ABC transporter substrate-binding protein [Pseudogulbenkiania sp. MAI-1]|uniref:substrate-binding periplasmic protein n=1 Tax=Pseudogulbenkiania sp. MAI-1 TaxID=990370 RepID=UPI0004AD8690|nr:transporter substrate-binding domain-containing protein [Pseudogulbenkiania sp. MAI-1]